jgi:cell division inhibitor SepF
MAMFRNVMVYLGLGPDDEYDENYLYDEDNVDFEGLERRTGGGPRTDADGDDLGIGAVRPLRPVPDGPGPAGESRPFSDLRAGGPLSSGREISPEPTPAAAEHPSAAGMGDSSIFAEPPTTRGSRESISFDEEPSPFIEPTTESQSRSRTPERTSEFSQNEGSSFSMDEPSMTNSRGAKPRTVVPRAFDDAKNVANEYQAGSPVVMNLREADKETGRRLLDFSSGMVYGLGGGMEKLAANVFLISPDGVEVSADDRRRLEERGYGR